MNVLSIDTVGLQPNSFSVSIATDAGVFTECMHFNSRQYLERLLPCIDRLLQTADCSKNDVQTVLVAQGPGAFTGLRLAYATAKALTLANNTKLIEVPTLAALETACMPYSGQVLAAVDAKRQSVYGQLFDNHEPITEVADKPFAEFLPLLTDEHPLCICVGYQNIMQTVAPRLISGKRVQFIEPTPPFSLLLLTYFRQHSEMLLWNTVSDYAGPVYVRPSDAKVKTE